MVEVYAKRVDKNTVTIYGSTDYFIKNIQEDKSLLLQQCPDEWIRDLSPCDAPEGAECEMLQPIYYMLDDQRRELTEFDNEWVESNCELTLKEIP